MPSDPDALVAVIGETLAEIKAAPHSRPKRFRIHPLDVQALERRYPSTPAESPGWTLKDSINKLLGVPVEQDCGVRRGQPEVDYG